MTVVIPCTCCLRRLFLLLLATAITGLSAERPATAADAPKRDAAETRPEDRSWYVDDTKLGSEFYAKLADLAAQGKCYRSKDMQHSPHAYKLKLAPAVGPRKRRSPGEVYRRALDSVFVLGSIAEVEKGQWKGAGQGAAWALTDDGVLVTNWHFFEEAKNECIGVANRKGEVFPVTEVLGFDPADDIALIRVAGKGFVPLPLAGEEPVGNWVGVLSHPGGQFYTFTQGHITRYTVDHEENKVQHWMSISADFAIGSSGAPVLNRYGEVVGMATMTVAIEANKPEETGGEPPSAAKPANQKSGKPGEKGRQAAPARPHAGNAKGAHKDGPQPGADDGATGSAEKAEPEEPPLQMVVKLAVPGQVIRDFCEKDAKSPPLKNK